MEILVIVLSALLILAGIAGSLLPVLPGLPLSYLGLLLLHFATDYTFSTLFLVVWAVVILVIQLLDYYVPIWGTRRFGGTKKGVWGSTIGLLVGLFMGPWGIILGPFLGAFIGEQLSHKDIQQSFQSALGSFIGIVFGAIIKLIAGGMMLYYFIARIV
ncbi:MAG: DUF456 domain-containing protein [Bacteroidales bacterium]|jgi:hypothetical protein|nr:DUF456 domain-containing protein [Bacteroidales bacterium]OJX89763.1 MAG: hypothetical protein BGP01_06015 [Paludibacter sp. 47-17]